MSLDFGQVVCLLLVVLGGVWIARRRPRQDTPHVSQPSRWRITWGIWWDW